MRRRWRRIGLIAAGVLVVAWGVSRAIADRRDREELRAAGREIQSGRFEPARAILSRLSARRPGRAEVEYPRGLCAEATGHPAEAFAAWALVPPETKDYARAALGRARLAIFALGRYADAEAILTPLLHESGPTALEARELLARLYRLEGRDDDVRRLVREGWERAPDRALALRALWLLDADPPAVGELRVALEQAAKRAPEDDRVWLGRANLALQTGALDEAARKLDACLRRRPEDAAVWRAKLNASMAANQVSEAAAALRHLPAESFDPVAVARLRAWFAARSRDPRAERIELERLLALDPGDTRALERLAVCALDAGDEASAKTLRRLKAEVDRAEARYREILTPKAGLKPYAELARLAEIQGRRFEARGWWTLTVLRSPDDPAPRAALVRLEARMENPPATSGRTLADLLADRLANLKPVVAPIAPEAPPLPSFTDDAEAVGLRFVHESGRTGVPHYPEAMTGGVALLDYDGDGWLDVYAVQGGPFPPPSDRPAFGDRLFHNRGDGTFEDATESSGLAAFPGGYGHGVSVADFDNDGHPDLFVTRWRAYALYRNRGDGTFEDATGRAGFGGDRDWPTSSAWADFDGDGDLDLYVAHYLAWDAEHPRPCREQAGGKTVHTHCDPRAFKSMPDHLFRNDGGTFVDATAEAGIDDHDGRGLGVVAADLDDDGRVDLFVANDSSANFLFRNLGGFRFEECGLAAGVACNAGGGFQAGMGIACGDLDGDGRIDLAVTNFYGESTTFFRNLGGGMFGDATAAIGLAAPSRFLLGFGVVMLDANHDGRLDLASANGHVNDLRPNVPFAMPAQLLLGGGDGRLVDATDRAGPPWQIPRIGRGLAAGDLDNDGRIDLVLLDRDGPLAYVHNRTPAAGHFVTFRLDATAGAREAVGARVAVTAGGRRQVAQRFGGGSFQSAGDPRLHFGLGAAERVESVEVRWPSGRVECHHDLAADAAYVLRESEAGPGRMPGWR